LKKSPFLEVSMQELVQQIKGRKVAEKKFPFLNQENIIFPPNLNLEQASSQDTAEYKAQFFKGKKFLDLTCGLGIDAYFLSRNFEKITLIEQNAELLEIVKHNWEVLGRKANFINQKLEDFLESNQEKFDLIYLDPARRDNHNRKVFLLEDLSPNLIEIQEKLGEISEEILIKLSPLIDLQHLASSLQNIAKIWIIAVKNEVKEVLIHIKKRDEETEISCINLQSSEPEFNFTLNDEKNCKPEFSVPEKYIFIPNNSVLKSGSFNLVSEKFNLKKLHPNSHLYTSENLINEFPGRIFEVAEINPKEIKKGEKFNIITKNYPLKPEEIKKKYKIKDGGEDYLIFSQSSQNKHILKAKLL
jgi:SAM-dependent methyltransferase